MDVKSLCTSISSHEGTEAVKEKLNAQSEKPIAAKVTIKPLFLILTLNYFIFNSINYLHKIVAQEEPSAHHRMRICLLKRLNWQIFFRTSMTKQ